TSLEVLVAGGEGVGGQLNDAEIYSSFTHEFTLAAPMAHSRVGHAAVRLSDGTVLIAGGCCSPVTLTPYLQTAEVYNPKVNSFAPTAGKMTAVRYLPVAVLL